ncbi:hypothetical protein COE25_28155, partial [Bacillus sp. AFS031507]
KPPVLQLTGALVKISKGDLIMSIQVKLKDIIEEMEIQFEESRSFLNPVPIISVPFTKALPQWRRANVLF